MLIGRQPGKLACSGLSLYQNCCLREQHQVSHLWEPARRLSLQCFLKKTSVVVVPGRPQQSILPRLFVLHLHRALPVCHADCRAICLHDVIQTSQPLLREGALISQCYFKKDEAMQGGPIEQATCLSSRQHKGGWDLNSVSSKRRFLMISVSISLVSLFL